MATFLQMPRYLREDTKIGGWYAARGLAGLRLFWDGGLSRDMPASTVPWSTSIGKSSGLWTATGKAVVAPDWFLNLLPRMPLDGKLVGNNVRKIVAEGSVAGWDRFQYAIMDSPSVLAVFGDRKIGDRTVNYKYITGWIGRLDESRRADYVSVPPNARFEEVLVFLEKSLDQQSRVFLQRHVKLPLDEEQARRFLLTFAERYTLRHPYAPWTPRRVRTFLRTRVCTRQKTSYGTP